MQNEVEIGPGGAELFAAVAIAARNRDGIASSPGGDGIRKKWIIHSSSIRKQGSTNWNANSTTRGAKSFRLDNRVSNDELEEGKLQDSQVQLGSNFTTFQEDPIVDKLRTQLGVIHPIPKRRNKVSSSEDSFCGVWSQVPTSFSLFLEKDLQRKESVEWVNMVLGKLWKVYRGGLENWVIGLLQPVIDDLEKPDYVERVEIKQFSLGDEPLSVRNVERRTSRHIEKIDLLAWYASFELELLFWYQIGLRYTGGARMLLNLSLEFGIIPIVVPVGVRDFDIDGELWVKLRLIPTEPWAGAASWAFVSLPKIKFELSPFRLFNLMVDLPRLFVRPNKIVLDFQKGKAVGPVTVGPVADGVKDGEMQEGNMDSVSELSVTLVDTRKLPYLFGKTDPYVILSLGDQTICS
ncbi:hypothetical protein KIW84_055088 [Lathyrus oleraceus]|uniref:SMP-LTD domain-containing protein n=1 Tax=Pisum sativum TaxID=3888 RepID=A0A9D5AFD7_PEA|nr:hypothetical protein KIW84_055088 [Pisum sativum]